MLASDPITSWQTDGEKIETVTDFIFLAPKSLWMVAAAMYLETLAPFKKSYDQTRQHIKKQRHYFANQGSYSQSYGFSRSHAWMWELNHKEAWAPKNWCFWTVVLKKTLESLELHGDQINPKGNQHGLFIVKTDAEAEASILWSLNTSQLIGKDWCKERLKVGEEGDDRVQDAWMASQTPWTWV